MDRNDKTMQNFKDQVLRRAFAASTDRDKLASDYADPGCRKCNGRGVLGIFNAQTVVCDCWFKGFIGWKCMRIETIAAMCTEGTISLDWMSKDDFDFYYAARSLDFSAADYSKVLRRRRG